MCDRITGNTITELRAEIRTLNFLMNNNYEWIESPPSIYPSGGEKIT